MSSVSESPETPWNPSSLERKCLEQLDETSNWRLLKQEQPDQDVVLPWKPFRRIFWFNMVLFVPVMAVVIAVLNSALGNTFRDLFLFENFAWAFGFLALTSTAVSGFAANLYRQSWNRRARWLIGPASPTIG